MAATQVTVKALLDAVADKEQRRDALAAKVANGEDLTEVELTEYRSIKDVDIPALNVKLELVRDAETAKTRSFSPVTGANGNRDFSEGDKKDFAKFSLNRALSNLVEGRKQDGVEAEMHSEGTRQAFEDKLEVRGTGFVYGQLRGQSATGETTNAGDQGGKFIQTDKLDLIEAFWSASVLSKVQATTLTGLVGNVSIPVQISKPVIQSRTEIEALTDQELLFSSVELAPERRGATIPYSLQFLRQTSFSVEQLLRKNILNAFATKADSEAVAAILAAVTTPGAVGGTNGAAPTYLNMLALIAAVEANDADAGSLAYLTNTKVRAKLMGTQKFASTNGEAVWTSPNSLLGYNAAVSNAVPSNIEKGNSLATLSSVIFGNFRDLIVGQWGIIEFIVDPYTKKKNAQVEITANTFWDIVVARAESFSTMEDIVTTL